MLNITKLEKKIENILILDNISFNVKQGEFVAIFGPNGCGKTTLLSILAGLDEEYKGEIQINNKKPTEAKSGFVFQNFHESLLPWMTVEENIQLAATNAESWIKKLELEKLTKQYPYQLSGGQKQLVSIARAYAYEPDLLLFDEPFSALDYSITLKMQELVQKLWMETGKTSLFISHDPEEAVFLADRVIVLSEKPGKIKKDIKINLSRPRTAKTRLSKKFFEYRNKVIEAFTK